MEMNTLIRRFRVNVKKTKMMIISENVGKVTEGEKFLRAVYKKYWGSDTIFCQLCMCRILKTYSGIKGKPKKICKFKCQTCTNIIIQDKSLEI